VNLPPPCLTDLAADGAGSARVLHGLATRSPARFLRRVAEVGWELATTGLLDAWRPLTGGLTRQAPGRASWRGQSLCLYLHWSPTGAVSAMVLDQVEGWRALGFDVVFVSNTRMPEADWNRVGEATALRLTRDNVGRDFGAWRDALALALPLALARFGTPRELLLANDSVLGPIRPLPPLVAAWRAGGEGLFGMTESPGGGPHLQSYALLARGEAAVGVVSQHLAAQRDRRGKWRVVREGELGLTARARAAGVRCAALFGYARVLAAVDAPARAALGPRFASADALARFPLNPTHHLWRVLVERLGFPYLKTELIRRNPGRLPGVEDWRALVGPAELARIEAHLAGLQTPG
jgi:hypothetical protein